jgi:putative hydrolase of the HAD superfamily
MKMNLKLAVVSDAPSREAWLRLCYLNLHHIFDAVVTFDDTKMRKPNPEPFVEVLRRLGVRAEESLMIGDWAERDMVGAAQVGMKTIFARYGDTFGTVVSHADYEVDDITQVIDIVTQLNSGS